MFELFFKLFGKKKVPEKKTDIKPEPPKSRPKAPVTPPAARQSSPARNATRDDDQIIPWVSEGYPRHSSSSAYDTPSRSHDSGSDSSCRRSSDSDYGSSSSSDSSSCSGGSSD